MKSLRDQLQQFARHPFPILLEGETGVGKELCAQFVHAASGRSGRLVAVNAALLDPGRAEGELFGHEKGAFTGAVSKRSGRIREAEGGTFFLDELHAAPLAIQSMLLRAFNHAIDGELEVVPLGQEKEIKVDTRLVTAVQPGAVASEKIREDLFYRVMGLHVVIPPLRDRGDDVVEIAEKVIQTLYERHQVGPRSVAADARKLLCGYAWPGNVRQLHMVMRKAWVANQNHSALSAARLSPYMPKDLMGRPHDAEVTRSRVALSDLRCEVHAMTNDRIRSATEQHPRSTNEAARALGFDTGQSMKRYLAKTKRDAAEDRRRPK
jgi:transcriptional regulator with PAS, ATPase and Fis domain